MLGWLAGPACGISFKRSVRIELALEMGWSRILTDLQVRAAEADGKHFSLSGSLFVINASAQLLRES